MNVCKIQLVIKTRHVLTQKDRLSVYVILVTMVMESACNGMETIIEIWSIEISSGNKFFNGCLVSLCCSI